MLVAQIRFNPREQTYWMEPGFLAHEHAKLIAEKGQNSIEPPSNTSSASETQDLNK